MPELPTQGDDQLGDPLKIDFSIVARDLKLPPEKIAKTVELLDAGNTIPFVTRFRKDLTGGLNEQQVLAIKQRVGQLRALAERKTFVLKSIDSQGNLSEDLALQIKKATTSRRLEDLYLPFKPQKQSRAALARQQGLEPLADDILQANSPDVEIATRATEFVRVDKGLNSVDDVIKGVGDILAEKFSGNDELRSKLRRIMWSDGKLAAESIVKPEQKSEPDSVTPATNEIGANEPAATTETVSTSEPQDSPETSKQQDSPETSKQQAKIDSDQPVEGATPLKAVSEATPVETAPAVEADPAVETASEGPSENGQNQEDKLGDAVVEEEAVAKGSPVEAEASEAAVVQAPNEDAAANEEAKPSDEATPGEKDSKDVAVKSVSEDAVASVVEAEGAESTAKPKKKKKKKKKKKPVEDPFKDYKDFAQPIKQLPHHRVLAINRGERSGNLRVKIVVEGDALTTMADSLLVPADHPFREFLLKCSNDALSRLIQPGLEREIRRELTEVAEQHAVEVFANNLRNLLLQPPMRNRKVMAIDPGFKRGCSVAVLDASGNLLDSGHVFVVGNQTRRDESKQKLAVWVKQHQVDLIAIGNGAACRQTEQLVSDLIADELQEFKTTYTMVNEAGASIYSTSEIGRVEHAELSPSIRSAVSIGRRLQDPLSELVKISPANIGVGMYQHDVKAKHLSESLDEVVRFCVNQVGVDVNTASPSLLKYVSGLNSLTARRVVEYRQEHGRFENRDDLKKVSGFGDATFVQAAGFLRVHGGDSPLDCTSIHPESYGIASDVLDRIGVSMEEFFAREIAYGKARALAAVVEAPVVEAPVVEAPVVETPAVETPAVETPAVETPAVETPAVETQAVEVQAVEVPAVEVPAGSVEGDQGGAALEGTVSVNPSEGIPEAEKSEAEKSEAEKSEAEAAMVRMQAEREKRSANRKELLKKINDLDVQALADQHVAGRLLVRDILLALKRPQWDPRDKVNKPIFRRGIIKVDDLKSEMQLDAQVVNVVDFGVFVDIGLGESSLVHVSQLSNHFIKDPHRFFSVGDVLKVWVSEIDAERRRVKLTAIRPGSKKPSGRRGKSGKPAESRGESKSGATDRQSGSSPAGTRKPGKYGGGKGRSTSRPGYAKGTFNKKSFAKKAKPKVVKPITDKMLKGDEPMRSFSDLAQFVNKSPQDSEKKTDGQK
ncbi:helix-hairpin-helix domain-containing protein [Mariniblastus sp.]|nr:helix-hairpin-helix domain-containing protein [Mariniblastus sp.]